MPDVPTFIEAGVPDFDINSWVGLLAPAKTPRAIVDKLNTELNVVLNDPAVRERLNTLGITASPGGPEAQPHAPTSPPSPSEASRPTAPRSHGL